MKYKALFLDLDGTTVQTQQNEPSERVIKAITKAKERLTVCIATGRLFYQVDEVVKHLKINGLCVVANGIQIYDPVKKQTINEIGMEESIIQPIYKALKKYSSDVHSFDGKDELVYNEKQPSLKTLSFYIPRADIETVEKIEVAMRAFPTIVVHKLTTLEEGYLGLEICSAKATKLHGIQEVAKRLNIDTHEIIGVGDGYNDFPLLMACGLKFAMGNAVDELKSIADFVAPSVENDGVAVIIEKFILNE